MFDATDKEFNLVLLRSEIASALSEVPAAPYEGTAWLRFGSKKIKLAIDIDPDQVIQSDLSQVLRQCLARNNMVLLIGIPARSATPESLTELIFRVIQIGPDEEELKQDASGYEVSVKSKEKGPSRVKIMFSKRSTLSVEDQSESKGGRQLGLENFGALRQAVQSARFTQKQKLVLQSGDILAGINDARRELQNGRVSEALKAVDRLSAMFDQRVARWERLAAAKEQNLSRSPGSMSLGEITKMRAEHTKVRKDYRLALTKFRRLRNEIGQLEMTAQRQEAAQDSASGNQRKTPPRN